MTAPIPFTTSRYRCPHCPRTAASRTRMREHMARCWNNPAARGCKTCKHFEAYGPEWGDSCAVGVSLAGQPAFVPCPAHAEESPFGESGCGDCRGDGRAVPPGPIVYCDLWEAIA